MVVKEVADHSNCAECLVDTQEFTREMHFNPCLTVTLGEMEYKRRLNLNNPYLYTLASHSCENALFRNMNATLRMYKYCYLYLDTIYAKGQMKSPHRDFVYWPPNRGVRLIGGRLGCHSLVVGYLFRSPTTNTI